ncbi:MAG: patatin-like phospholipase family protein [Candidatus Omnitrophica bacterium]|nr:patatin-like phospholipase family protein [Candidatus Omnitrophota bacterium]
MNEKNQPVGERGGRERGRIGLVLGGGAALGLAHVGVIRALEEENIQVDVVVGCSMGALVGALWVTGRNADDLEKIAKEFSKKSGLLKLFDPPIGRGLILLGISGFLWACGYSVLAAFFVVLLVLVGLVPVSGVVNGQAIGHWLRRKVGRVTFDETRIPLRVVACDLLHRREIVVDQGLITDAVFKSMALPGIIPPVMESGQMIVDGGVLNPLPVNVLLDMGVKKIIAVNVLQSPEDACQGEEREAERLKKLSRVSFFQNPWQYFVFRLQRHVNKALSPNIADVIVRTLQASQYGSSQASGQKAEVLITPDLSGIAWFELYKADILIQRGHDAAIKCLPAIRALVNK